MIMLNSIFALGLALAASAQIPTPQLKKRKAPSTSAPLVTITYASSPWNKNPAEIDTAFLFLRDNSSGKLVKIILQESEPDSSTFRGSFSLGWTEKISVEPEVYIPPKTMRDDGSAIEKFNLMVVNRQVRRQPLVFKKNADGSQELDVYDTKDQATRAYEAYKKQKEALKSDTPSIKPIPNEATLEAARQAEMKRAVEKLAQEATAREIERIRLEQLERQKMMERQKEQERLSAAEKKKRADEAQRLAEQAMVQYQNGEYREAAALFAQSVSLDPDNKTYYFQYAITLYRLEEFNEALVTMKVAPSSPESEIERKYYMGLIHYRLKEVDASLQNFTDVEKANVENFSPSAAFYKGLILFSLERLEEAKTSFELVLDISKDPKLDEQAEEYIEKIAEIQNYKRLEGKKFRAKLTAGLIYDSNILFAPDGNSDQGGSAADKGGGRVMASGTAEYRVVNNTKREWATKYDGVYMYSFDDAFVAADPFLNTVALPFTMKGTWKSKGYKWSINPGYEALFMDAEDTGTRENILNTMLLGNELTLIMRSDWFASYSLDLRSEDSRLSSSVGDNDFDAFKTTLGTSQTFFFDQARKRAFVAGGKISQNAAKGDNKIFNRLDLSATYLHPFAPWDAQLIYGLSVYKLQYPDDEDDREDTDMAVNLGVSKALNSWTSLVVNFNYTNNQSTVDSYAYSKYSLTTLVTFDWGRK